MSVWVFRWLCRCLDSVGLVVQVVAGRDLSPEECASEHPGEATPSGRVPGSLLRVKRLLLDSQGQVGMDELLGQGNGGDLLLILKQNVT